MEPAGCAVSCLAQLTPQWEIYRQQSRLTAGVTGPGKAAAGRKRAALEGATER